MYTLWRSCTLWIVWVWFVLIELRLCTCFWSEEKAGNCWWGRQMTNGQQTMRKIQTSAFNTWCLCQVKEERQQQKEERSREGDRWEGKTIRQTTTERRKKQRRGQTRRRQPFFRLPLSSSLLLSSCCCLSFFFYLTKTLSVKRARLYFSHCLLSTGEYIFQSSFPHVFGQSNVWACWKL